MSPPLVLLVLAVTDEYGNKVVERDFTPFGERINTDVYDDEPRDLDEDESGFTGKDWDEDVGLYYYSARWYDPEVGRFISEDSVNDPNNQGNVYAYCSGNPINNIDPTGHFVTGIDGIINGLNNISKTLNLLGNFDSRIGKFASSFNVFVGALNQINGLSSKINGDYVVTSERTVQDTGIDGVSYKETIKQTYKKNKLVASETTQMFMSDAGEITIVTKSGGSDGFSQTYTFEASDKDPNKRVTRAITFKSGEKGEEQINLITQEGFVHKNSTNKTETAYGALTIGTTKQGAIGAVQTSSLPNSSKFATIAETTGDPYIMTRMNHKGDSTLYASVGISMDYNQSLKTPTEGLNPYPGKLDEDGNVIKGTENPNYQTGFATGIEFHSGDTVLNRGSMGCQTVNPTMWNEFSNMLKLDERKNGDFIGFYYLFRYLNP